MSYPLRITNPGAESLGYDSDGHEIMAVDIYVNPPRADVFHGTPAAWSSFWIKTIWGSNEWAADSPTRTGIVKRAEEIPENKKPTTSNEIQMQDQPCPLSTSSSPG
ncbi:hypothetical protein, partial [Escherichia coli]|uniref:hypothetical protein n=1 Tax=Escherichia coli TaxID=562 RepID=UPI002167846C